MTSENKRWEQHAKDTETQSNIMAKDIERREKKLADERTVFETEKKALQPKMNKISEMNNQNTELLRKIEDAEKSVELERGKMAYEHERNKQELDQAKENYRNLENEIIQQKSALDKREEQLADLELEVQAREAKADQLIKRYNLTKVIEDSKKDIGAS